MMKVNVKLQSQWSHRFHVQAHEDSGPYEFPLCSCPKQVDYKKVNLMKVMTGTQTYHTE